MISKSWIRLSVIAWYRIHFTHLQLLLLPQLLSVLLKQVVLVQLLSFEIIKCQPLIDILTFFHLPGSEKKMIYWTGHQSLEDWPSEDDLARKTRQINHQVMRIVIYHVAQVAFKQNDNALCGVCSSVWLSVGMVHHSWTTLAQKSLLAVLGS